MEERTRTYAKKLGKYFAKVTKRSFDNFNKSYKI